MTGNGHDKELEQLAQQLRDAQVRIKELENELKKTNTEKAILEKNTIPDAMLERGYNEVILQSGAKLTVRPEYYARLAKNSEGQPDITRRNQFFHWLDTNGYNGLVKSHFEVRTSDPELVGYLRMVCSKEVAGEDIQFDLGRDIHHKTLESWFREQMEKGVNLPLELFDNYIGRKVTLR